MQVRVKRIRFSLLGFSDQDRTRETRDAVWVDQREPRAHPLTAQLVGGEPAMNGVVADAEQRAHALTVIIFGGDAVSAGETPAVVWSNIGLKSPGAECALVT